MASNFWNCWVVADIGALPNRLWYYWLFYNLRLLTIYLSNDAIRRRRAFSQRKTTTFGSPVHSQFTEMAIRNFDFAAFSTAGN
jgi:hypothetical protein